MNKRSLSILLLSLFLCIGFTSFAQLDSRNRTPETVISDGLAQLPAKDSKTYNEVIGEMAATGQKGIEMISAMLKPASTNQNATFEYAIDAIVSYATKADNASMRKGIHDGLVASIKNCGDDANKAFLLTQLNKVSDAGDAGLYIACLGDKYLKPYAITGLAQTPGIDAEVGKLINSTGTPDAGLAYVAYFRGLKNVEPQLLKWASSADGKTLEAIYNALAKVGSEASLATLQKAAKAARYGNDPTGATDAYLRLLGNIDDTKAVIAAAKELTKCSNPSARCAGLSLLLDTDNANAQKNIIAALKDKNIDYRNTALLKAQATAGDGIFDAVASKYKSLSPAAKIDVLAWLGNNHVTSQTDLVADETSSKDNAIALTAIAAASKIGGNRSLEALVACLGKDATVSAAAQNALLSFNGDINKGILAALDSEDSNVVSQALNLASKRHVYDACEKVMTLVVNPDKTLNMTAIEGLKGVARPGNFNEICNLLESVTEPEAIAKLQEAAKSSIAGLPADDQYKKIEERLSKHQNDRYTPLYYPMFAQAGNAQAIDRLLKDYKAGKSGALEALLQVNNTEMIPVLYDLAVSNPDKKDAIINRYIGLVGSSNQPALYYELYKKALDLKPSDATTNSLLSALATSRSLPAAMLAAQYLDNTATALAAATTVKNIIAKDESLQQGETVRSILEKVHKVFIDFKVNDADAGYAADEIAGILNGFNGNGGYTAVNGGNPEGDFENFDMYFDWNGNDPVVLTLRSMPVVTIDPVNGMTYAGKAYPLAKGPHNFHIRMVNDRIFIEGAGQNFVTNEIVVNPEADKKAPETGAIALDNTAAISNFYLNHLPDTPVFTLSDEEAAQGFEVLFDGRSLDKWHGNTSAYVPVDGNIYVTAQYGGSGNLYTKKNYSDFIYRFEFWFDVPAVNNGIGIRTGKDVTGVDAAFHGMEIQVLDHDDPVYQGHPFGYTGLQPYQNHGSVYGVVPSKHVDFGPIKQWHTEEIKAIGDRITVTVDGEVILDADIREACQGNPVAPDGGTYNPYTIDHRNHPGLFNKEGYISFCGHGSGVKFRNVRILDLSDKNKSKKPRKR